MQNDSTENCVKKYSLVIHGGSGNIFQKNLSPEIQQKYHEALKEALQKGHQILSKSGSAADAVEAAIVAMEDCPLFNAGKGAVFTSKLTNQLDASFMDGNSMKAGAVAGVKTIKNPIKAARAVAYNSQFVMLMGEGAEEFAKDQQLDIVEKGYFFDQNRFNQVKHLQKQIEERKINEGSPKPNASQIQFNMVSIPHFEAEQKFGTVGAVALDMEGNIAAGTSTGGMMNKKYGRVGDSPIIGAGNYANNKTCGISCTGHGEYFLRGVVAYDVSAMMEYKGVSLKQSASEIIHKKLVSIGGFGGLIGVDGEGNIVAEYNTTGMYRGWVKNRWKNSHAYLLIDQRKPMIACQCISQFENLSFALEDYFI